MRRAVTALFLTATTSALGVGPAASQDGKGKAQAAPKAAVDHLVGHSWSLTYPDQFAFVLLGITADKDDIAAKGALMIDGRPSEGSFSLTSASAPGGNVDIALNLLGAFRTEAVEGEVVVKCLALSVKTAKGGREDRRLDFRMPVGPVERGAAEVGVRFDSEHYARFGPWQRKADGTMKGEVRK